MANTGPAGFIVWNTCSNKHHKWLYNPDFIPPLCHIVVFLLSVCVHIEVQKNILDQSMCDFVSCSDKSSPGNASALNALDPCACLSSAVKHVRTHAHLATLSSVILLCGYWLPPLHLPILSPHWHPVSATHRLRYFPLASVHCECGYFPLRGSLDSARCAARALLQHHHNLLIPHWASPCSSCHQPLFLVIYFSVTCSPPPLFSFLLQPPPLHFQPTVSACFSLILTFIHLYHLLAFQWCVETWRWVEEVYFQALRSNYSVFLLCLNHLSLFVF